VGVPRTYSRSYNLRGVGGSDDLRTGILFWGMSACMSWVRLAGAGGVRVVRPRVIANHDHLDIPGDGWILHFMVKYGLDATATAIASAPRRAIIERLVCGPASMSQLATELEVTLAAVDKHLRVLLAGGLVTKAKQGRTTVVRLNAGSLQELADWAMSTRLMWTTLLDRFEDHVSDPANEER